MRTPPVPADLLAAIGTQDCTGGMRTRRRVSHTGKLAHGKPAHYRGRKWTVERMTMRRSYVPGSTPGVRSKRAFGAQALVDLSRLMDEYGQYWKRVEINAVHIGGTGQGSGRLA
jgi:hypothetical protein